MGYFLFFGGTIPLTIKTSTPEQNSLRYEGP